MTNDYKLNYVIDDRGIIDAWETYLEQLEWYENYLERKLPRTFNKLKIRFDSFWNSWVSKQPELNKEEKLKNDIFEIITYQLNQRIYSDRNLKKAANQYEIYLKKPSIKGRKSLMEMTIKYSIEQLFELSELIILAYEQSEGLKIKNIRLLKSYLDKLQERKDPEKLILTPAQREELEEKILNEVTEYLDRGDGTRKDAFNYLAKRSEEIFDFEVTQGSIQGRYERGLKKFPEYKRRK